MKGITILSLVLLVACSGHKDHLEPNKKLQAEIQQRTDAKTLEAVKAEEATASKKIHLDEKSPLLIWNEKNAPYQLVQLTVKSKARSLVVKSSYDKEWKEKRAVVPVVVLMTEDEQIELERTKVEDNPYCGLNRCLEIHYSLKKIPAGNYKALVLAPLIEGKKAKKNFNDASGLQVHHTYYGDLELSVSEKN